MKKREALDILGLSDGATDDEIKAAHRTKVRATHPDRFTDPTEKAAAEEQTKLINEARDVLVNRKWDPEYGPRAATGGTYTNPYAQTTSSGGTRYTYTYTGNPFTGSAYTGQASSGTKSGDTQNSTNPFEGFESIPFTYVWTSWDDIGSSTGGHRSQSTHTTADPFTSANPFDPFAAMFTREPRKTDEQRMSEAKAELRSFAGFVGVKAAVLAVCAALGGVASGMFAYVIATVLYMISREVQGCSSLLVIPFVLFFGPAIMWFIPSFGSGITNGLLIFFIIAIAYDFGTGRRLLEQYRTLRAKANIPKK